MTSWYAKRHHDYKGEPIRLTYEEVWKVAEFCKDNRIVFMLESVKDEERGVLDLRLRDETYREKVEGYIKTLREQEKKKYEGFRGDRN
jgi:hypothetical protein